jgi:PAS domain S-box-containing protein
MKISKQAGMILIGGLLLAGICFSTLKDHYKNLWTDQFLRQVNLNMLQWAGKLETNEVALHGIASLFESSAFVSREEFNVSVQPLLKRHLFIHAIDWAPLVLSSERDSFEANAQKEGLTDYQIKVPAEDGNWIRAGQREEFFPIIYREPAKGGEWVLGFDQLSSPAGKEVIDKSRNSGKTLATKVFTLEQNSAKQPVVLVFIPAYKNGQIPKSILEEKNKLIGYLFGVYHIEKMIEAGIIPYLPKGLSLTIYQGKEDLENLIYGGLSVHSPLIVKSELDFFGQPWTVVWQGSNEFLGGVNRVDAYLGSGIIFLISVFLSTIFQMNTSRRGQIEIEVVNRTKALKEAEAKIKENQRFLETLISHLPGTVYRGSCDKDWSFDFISNGCEKLTGYPPSSLINKQPSYGDLIIPEDQDYVWNEVQVALKESRPFQLTYRLKHRSGEIKWVWEQGSGIHDEHNELILEGFFLDITDLKQVEEELIQAREKADSASRIKSQFISAMSHELRTPMNAILGFSQVLKNDKEINDKHRKMVTSIHKTGNHLMGLIRDILDFAKPEKASTELEHIDFDLANLLKDLSIGFNGSCKEKNLDWHEECFDENRHVLLNGDRGKLRKTIINLLTNAVKFTESGSVSMRVSETSKDHYRFEILDTGPGIPLDQQEIIFESFHQEEKGFKKGGLGLGLSVAKNNVALMGGELLVESDLGKGSRFFFTLNLPPAKHDIAFLDQQIEITIEEEMEKTGANSENDELDLTKIKLPQSLVDSMKEDVKSGLFMDIEEYFSEIEALGSDGQKLTAQLKELAGQYDDESILKILDKIEKN